MSIFEINQYYRELEKAKSYSRSEKETSIRRYFSNLLSTYARKNNLELVDEVKLEKSNKVPDGTLFDALNLRRGYWESKDTNDDLDKEIEKKFSIGYPQNNIIFEDSQRIVLIQNGETVADTDMTDAEKLHNVLEGFINYEPTEIKKFTKALEQFKEDIPKISKNLREFINNQAKENKNYIDKRNLFFEECKKDINPQITIADIREMIIQHILTEDIFNAIFGEKDFHRENNIAKNLDDIINTFMTRAVRKDYLKNIEHYYTTLNTTASNISDYNEKQKFLKLIYENFYKVYNPKGADKLGVVYTPNEIVKFMIESTDYLLYQNFGRGLQDKNVQILDPATGTGTFVTDIINYIPKKYLEYKYKNEIHCNEISILPYYIANLNIEYTYYQKMENYLEYENICFVDTLDNFHALSKEGKQAGIFDSMVSKENAQRINKQNELDISVIIGNPPYNANQLNFNDFNPNKAYKNIDERIKTTFVKESKVSNKANLYDMYTRFYRWAMDRMKTQGVISFITNRSFIDAMAFDGFRKSIQKDFQDIYVVDLVADVRKNPKIAGTTHNVFGIQTGVAIMFLVKSSAKTSNNIKYYTLTDEMLKQEKIDWLEANHFDKIPFETIKPDKYNAWLNQSTTDFEELIPLCSKEVKNLKGKEAQINTIFRTYYIGLVTARDSWVYDFDKKNLEDKVKYFIKTYNESIISKKINDSIKFSYKLLNSCFLKNIKVNNFDKKLNIISLFRPFIKKHHYIDKIMNNDFGGNQYSLLGQKLNKENKIIAFMSLGRSEQFYSLGSDKLVDYHFTGDSQTLPLYTYTSEGDKVDNITDYGMRLFREHYKDQSITKEDIFYYVYGVLNSPWYIEKYENDLKKHLPRIGLYKEFKKIKTAGKKLMDLHINYEACKPYNIKVEESDKEAGKPKLKRDKTTGDIYIDEKTTLKGIPLEAYEYKLGNRSPIDWVLDQYKEKKISDPTIAEKFNTYKFANYKDEVVLLIKKLITLSLGTLEVKKELSIFENK